MTDGVAASGPPAKTSMSKERAQDGAGVDSGPLGKVVYRRDRAVKLILADHKDAVSAILRSLVR